MDIDSELFKIEKSDYGDNYQAHYLEQYKLYVEMADRISIRRQSANTFFLSVNTAIIAVIGYIQLGQSAGTSKAFYWLVSLAGMTLCYSWYRLIRSYKDLNSGKFRVVHAIEKRLPIALYDAEWTSLEKGKNPKLYHPFTKIEMIVPWIFFVLHFSVLLQLVPWASAISLLCE